MPSAPGPRGLEMRSLRDQAAAALRARIIAGELHPERLYVIGHVAEELGVSATPIREALLDLAKEGLVRMVRNRGFRITAMTERDIEEIVQLRRMIEVPAIREISERRLISDDTELRRLIAETEAAALASDWLAFHQKDRAFHLGVLAWLGNQRLVDYIGSLRDQCRLYGTDRDKAIGDFLESTREHEALLDAIVSGRADEAVRLTHEHLDLAREVWSRHTG